MKGKTILTCAVILWICLSLHEAWAQPTLPPCIFYGYVLVGGTPARDGLNVTAFISGTMLNWTTETGGGTYGWPAKGSSLLQIPSDNPEISGKDGGATGNQLDFYVQGVKASQSGTFESGGAKELDLSVAEVPGEESNSTLTVSVSCSSAYVGYRVELDGELAYANGTSISGADIVLAYWVTGGTLWNNITSVTTTIDGDYHDEWNPNTTGNYLIRASWEGNQTLSMSGAEADVSLAVTPLESKYVLSVVSSSNLTELVFNSTSRVLSFNLTDSSGAVGYANVTIAKDLIGQIGGLKVSLNGTTVYYTYTSTDVSWLLYFTYQHSTHDVVVEFGSLATPFIENLLIIAAIFVVVVSAGAAFYVVRRRLRHPHRKTGKLH